MRENAPFEEVQGFPAGLVVGLLVFDAVVLGLVSVTTRTAEGLNLGVVALTMVLMAVPIALVTGLRLRTAVAGGELRISLVVKRMIPLSEIASAEVRTYSPIMEYGGWGIRWGPGGKAYNARGNRGVQLVLRSGERVLVGSQRPEELLGALRGAGVA